MPQPPTGRLSRALLVNVNDADEDSRMSIGSTSSTGNIELIGRISVDDTPGTSGINFRSSSESIATTAVSVSKGSAPKRQTKNIRDLQMENSMQLSEQLQKQTDNSMLQKQYLDIQIERSQLAKQREEYQCQLAKMELEKAQILMSIEIDKQKKLAEMEIEAKRKEFGL